MSARDEILGRIRQRVSGGGSGVMPEIPFPQYVGGTAMDPLNRFTEMLESVHGSHDKVAAIGGIPEAVAGYLNRNGFGDSAVVTPDPILSEQDWGSLDVDFRAAQKDDVSSVTLAFAGIAETGTVVMASSAASPVSLNFLPEVNIVVLRLSSLLGTMEELWPLMDKQPRALNFITGPSKTADIEQTIVYGAHGPRFYHVILVEGD